MKPELIWLLWAVALTFAQMGERLGITEEGARLRFNRALAFADGLAKALAGRTTLEEVLRVTPPDPDLARKATSRAGAPPPAKSITLS
mgnify:CR=1 FL=1